MQTLLYIAHDAENAEDTEDTADTADAEEGIVDVVHFPIIGLSLLFSLVHV